jgi:hypothetical protein
MAHFFRSSYQTLQAIARLGRYEDVAAFLVIARHANGMPPAGIAPYRLSGAGVNAVHEKAGLSEETARGAVLRLQEAGFISPATGQTGEAIKPSYRARWEINQGELNLDLPHRLTDSVEVTSALRRIRGLSFHTAREDKHLAGSSDSSLRLDALMLLLAIYRHTSMARVGGLSPQCCYRSWGIKSQVPKLGGIRWGAEPELDNAFTTFMSECVERSSHSKKPELTNEQKNRFWLAWRNLKELGLIYEAVSLFDTDPTKNNTAQLICTLRVNDYHAGAADKGGDPSLLRNFEPQGSGFAYYTPEINERGEAEAMWLILPSKTGAIVGIWRPRFRAANKDAGSWIESDTANAEALCRTVLKAAAQAD